MEKEEKSLFKARALGTAKIPHVSAIADELEEEFDNDFQELTPAELAGEIAMAEIETERNTEDYQKFVDCEEDISDFLASGGDLDRLPERFVNSSEARNYPDYVDVLGEFNEAESIPF